MGKLISMLFYLILFAGCAGLRKTNTLSKTEKMESFRLQSDQLKRREWYKQSSDSNSAVLEIEIWPDGVVKYGPEAGFEGKIKRLKWRKIMQQHVKSVEKANGTDASTHYLQQQAQSKMELKHSEKSKMMPSIWLCLLMIPAGYFALTFWRRKRLL